MTALPLIGLLSQRSSSDWLPEAVAGRGAGAAVVDRCVIVGVGGGGVDALIVSVRAEQVVVVEVRVVSVVLLLRLHALECRGGRGQRRRRERRRQGGERCEGRYGRWQRGRRGFGVSVRDVVVLMVQVVVVVLGEVVSMLHVRAATVSVVHVHHVMLGVLRVVVEDGGEVGDG